MLIHHEHTVAPYHDEWVISRIAVFPSSCAPKEKGELTVKQLIQHFHQHPRKLGYTVPV